MASADRAASAEKGWTTAGSAAERAPASSRRAPAVAEPEMPASMAGFALVVYRELSQHLSQPNCKAIIAACAATAGVAQSSLAPMHLPIIAAQIERTFAVFGVRPELRARCLANLRAAVQEAEQRSEISIPIVQEGDVVAARATGREMSRELGFSEVAYVKVATAISELARNILKYAGTGRLTLRPLTGARKGIEVVASDQGPGIADIEAVLDPGYRSKTGMGAGLRGTRRLMDHFELTSQVGSGTTVIIRKYRE